MEPHLTALLARSLSKPLNAALSGKLYENITQIALQKRFSSLGLGPLMLVGRAGDRGVDLVGKWREIDFLVQCKATSKRIPGAVWRDLGGVYTQRLTLKTTPTMIALASPAPMTQPAFTEFMSSEIPYMHCILERARKADTTVPSVNSVVCNLAAQTLLYEHDIKIT